MGLTAQALHPGGTLVRHPAIDSASVGSLLSQLAVELPRRAADADRFARDAPGRCRVLRKQASYGRAVTPWPQVLPHHGGTTCPSREGCWQ